MLATGIPSSVIPMPRYVGCDHQKVNCKNSYLGVGCSQMRLDRRLEKQQLVLGQQNQLIKGLNKTVSFYGSGDDNDM